MTKNQYKKAMYSGAGKILCSNNQVRRTKEVSREERYFAVVTAELDSAALSATGQPLGEASVRERIQRAMMRGTDYHPDGGRFAPDFHARIAQGLPKAGSNLGYPVVVGVGGKVLSQRLAVRPAIQAGKPAGSEKDRNNARACLYLAESVVGHS